MPRRSILYAILALVCLTASLTVLAEPLAQGEVRVEIISPSSGETIRGRVSIIGSAVVPDFQFYKVEWGIGPNPGQWAVIGSVHDQPVTNGQLEVWDTTVVPDNVYTLRLTGVKNDGNWEEAYIRNLIVANAAPVATPAPSATPTPEGLTTPTATPPTEPTQTPQPGATPEPGAETEPEPAPTIGGVQIIAPTAALMQATPTPESDGDEGGSLLPFDTASLRDAFCSGGLAMGAVFVLLGIIFGIRRLL
jgi:hypothetical protein